MPTPRDRRFAIGASAVVLVVLGLGFYGSGSPRVQRQLAIDRARVDRMRQIANEIHNRPQLPASLDEIRSMYVRIGDPETDRPFEYHLNDATHYEMCANFAAESEDWRQRPNSRSYWAHPAGRYCYVINSKANPWAQY